MLQVGASGSEIERKFLVSGEPPDLDGAAVADLRQGYLVTCDAGEVRVRDAGGQCTLTVKSGRGLERVEREVILTREQFDVLWPATAGRRLEKRRYRIPVKGLVFELDVYRGELDGLLTVEVEFETVEQAHAFEPPAWFGRDVTGVDGYTNAELAVYGRPEGAHL